MNLYEIDLACPEPLASGTLSIKLVSFVDGSFGEMIVRYDAKEPRVIDMFTGGYKHPYRRLKHVDIGSHAPEEDNFIRGASFLFEPQYKQVCLGDAEAKRSFDAQLSSNRKMLHARGINWPVF